MIKFDLDDPKLTSFVLDELKGFDRDNVQAFLDHDGPARATVDDTRKSLAILRNAFPSLPEVDLSVSEKDELIAFWHNRRAQSSGWSVPRVFLALLVLGLIAMVILLLPEFFSRSRRSTGREATGESIRSGEGTTHDTPKSDGIRTGNTPKKTKGTEADGDAEKAEAAALAVPMAALPQGHWVIILDQGSSMRRSERLAGFVKALGEKVSRADDSNHYSLITFDGNHDQLRFEFATGSSVPGGASPGANSPDEAPAIREDLKGLGDASGMASSRGLGSALDRGFGIAHAHLSENSASTLILVTDQPLNLDPQEVSRFESRLKESNAPTFFVLGSGSKLSSSTAATTLTTAGKGRIFGIE